MIKRRSLLIGLGVGIMIGAALLQLMTYGQRLGDTPVVPEPLTVEQLQRQAEGQGYALRKLSEPAYTQAQLDDAVAKAKKEAAGSGKAATPEGSAPVKSAAPAATPENSEAPAASATPEPAKASAKADRLGLYVAPGDSLEKVATGLKALGVIQDKAAFIKAAKPYSGKMRVGLSVFEGQAAYDEIIAELLRKKN